MLINVNGVAREVPENILLADLISLLKLPGDRIAVELNHSVVRRMEWPSIKLREGDRLEIVHFVGGG